MTINFNILKCMTLAFFISFSVMAAKNGAPAPKFKLINHEGSQISLEQFKGKFIVLEWLNHGCPFVRKHYDSKNMQKLQEELKNQGVIWLSVISSARGKQGFSTPERANEDKLKYKSNAHHVLIDVDGKVGKSYEAKTTPHMFLIDTNGKLAYQGAIDDQADTDPKSIKTAINYVRNAYYDLQAKRTVKIPQTKAYGCSVKY